MDANGPEVPPKACMRQSVDNMRSPPSAVESTSAKLKRPGKGRDSERSIEFSYLGGRGGGGFAAQISDAEPGVLFSGLCG
jgi:hypothetical protein